MAGVSRDGDSYDCGATITATQTVVTADGIPVARIDDPGTHGSTQEQGASVMTAMGVFVARIGDNRTACPDPDPDHSPEPLATGSSVCTSA